MECRKGEWNNGIEGDRGTDCFTAQIPTVHSGHAATRNVRPLKQPSLLSSRVHNDKKLESG